MNKLMLAKQIIKIAKQLVGIQFATKQQMQKYLKDHPGADKRNHSVKKEQKKEKKVQREEQKEKDEPLYEYNIKKYLSDPKTSQKTLERIWEKSVENVWKNIEKDIDLPDYFEEVLSHENASPKLFERAYKLVQEGIEWYSGRYVLSRNPKTPENILKEIINGALGDMCVYDAIVNYYSRTEERKKKLPKVLKKELHKLNLDERENIAFKTNNSFTLQILSNDERESVRVNVARNPNTPVQTLQKLSNDKNEPFYMWKPYDKFVSVAGMVAQNPNTPKHILQKLSKNKYTNVRENVASNPNTPKHILQKLSSDEERDVRIGVAKNPNTPKHILQKLSSHKDEFVSNFAKKTLNDVRPFKIDWSKMSPELRQRLKDMSQEQIKKFLGWLSSRTKKPTSVPEQTQQQI